MAIATLLLILLVGFLALGGLAVVGSFLSPDARSKREELREARVEAAQAKAREKIATKALRAIANGAGNPILEATDALDNIENTYTKELN